jgi:MinD-like ATPase involved in chromosome partitioning or flagellar assembly
MSISPSSTGSIASRSDDEFLLILQTRFYVALRRASGRGIDLVWFRQNKEYAQAVLDFADTIADKELKETTRQLRRIQPV